MVLIHSASVLQDEEVRLNPLACLRRDHLKRINSFAVPVDRWITSKKIIIISRINMDTYARMSIYKYICACGCIYMR